MGTPPAPAPQYGAQYGHGWAFPHPPPPSPPERPEGADPWPRWPVWYGPAAMAVGLVATVMAVVILGAFLSAGGGDPTNNSAFNQIATVIQDVVFIGAAILFAARTGRPKAWQFGIRRSRFWPSVGWAAAGIGAFWVFAIVYSVIVRPKGEQDTLDSLGTNDSHLALVCAAVLVIVIAPVAEEFFFRGFFYRALRSRFSVAPAAIIDGVLFGAIHFQGASTLEILPVLAALGIMFCLVYERTGSLFTTIALHSLNNLIAYGGGTHEWGVAGIVGGAALLVWMTLPRLLPKTDPAMR